MWETIAGLRGNWTWAVTLLWGEPSRVSKGEAWKDQRSYGLNIP